MIDPRKEARPDGTVPQPNRLMAEPMSVWDTLAWARRARTGNPGRKAVLMALAEFSDEHASCYPSQQTLADATEQSVRTVRTHLATLEDMGLVAREHRGNGRGGRSSDRYYLQVQAANVAANPSLLAATATGVSGKAQGGYRQPVADELPQVEPPALEQQPRGGADVATVFAAWLDATGRSNRTVLDDKRRRLIVKALDTYPLDDVVDAVRGWQHSAHHRGDNDTRTVYNDLGLLLRDADHIERFRDLARGPSQPARTNGKGPTHRPIMDDRSVASGRIEL